ncbi:MAG: hypothetical protein AW07_02253 [Candidatus Accumulibacter sp. SK-11]|nr:MAG: hypothetical protein AW07_02253 [Candidatus Accumulibacter sp. SK-11]
MAQIRAIHLDGTATDIVEAVKEARERRLSRSGFADDGDRPAGRKREIDSVQNLAVGIIGEIHGGKADRHSPGGEVDGIGGIGDFPIHCQQVEHALDVGECLPDLPVDDAEEVQRHVELDEKGVDQDEITDRHAAVDDPAGSPPHHRRHPECDDPLLPKVQPRERDLATRRSVFPELHLLIVTPRFVVFVVEVLDGFVVQQAVDRSRVGCRIGFVEVAAQRDSPVADGYGEDHVGAQGGHRDQGQSDVVAKQQDGENDADLDQGWQNRVERIADQAGDRSAAALDVARHATGLPFEMKAQRQFVQVAEDVESDPPDGALRHARKEDFTQLGEQRSGETQGTIE